jgi:DNA gyrase/topoisomerase IV subunit A
MGNKETLMDSITLPVSLGEALDKLTILDIKLQKIKDSRRDDVQKEYDLLDKTLEIYRNRYAYYYKLLKEINLEIWELQDKFHGKNTTAEEGAAICKKILDENDRRFRVKAKLNHATSSTLKEQKGYAKRRAFVYGHLGLGDMFWMNGAVRYLATAYDEVAVVCKERNKVNVAAMYADDPTIHPFIIEDDYILHPFHLKRKIIEDQGVTIYSCGQHIQAPIYEFPHSFYDDFGLDRSIRTRYFHVPENSEAIQLYLAISSVSPKYIVVHQQSSSKTLPIWDAVNKKNPNIPILDVNTNHYSKGHPFHEIAELIVGKPLLHYKTLLELATEIHLLESSLYCFASHLDLSTVKGLYCYDAYDKSNERLGVFLTAKLDAY